MRTRGRPLGEKARAIIDAVRVEPRPIPRLAVDLQLSYGDATGNVRRLVSAGVLRYGERVPGLHDRPARIVELAPDPIPLGDVFRVFP